jgi:hypothetical protein
MVSKTFESAIKKEASLLGFSLNIHHKPMIFTRKITSDIVKATLEIVDPLR